MLRPDKILWPSGLELAKNNYLKMGFEKLKIPVENAGSIRDKFRSEAVQSFDVVVGDEKYRVYYDMKVNPMGVNIDFISEGSIYFKVHLDRKIQGKHERVFPIMQTTRPWQKYEELLKAGKARSGKDFKYDIMGIFRNTKEGMRERAVQITRNQSWNSLVGVESNARYRASADINMKKLEYKKHLQTQCNSQLCLALPGGGGGFCSFRHVEIWAMGCCCLTLREPNTVLLGNPKDCWIGFSDDLSDFVDVVNHYLARPGECERIARNGRDYFLRHYAPERHIEYIMNTLEKELM